MWWQQPRWHVSKDCHHVCLLRCNVRSVPWRIVASFLQPEPLIAAGTDHGLLCTIGENSSAVINKIAFGEPVWAVSFAPNRMATSFCESLYLLYSVRCTPVSMDTSYELCVCVSVCTLWLDWSRYGESKV